MELKKDQLLSNFEKTKKYESPLTEYITNALLLKLFSHLFKLAKGLWPTGNGSMIHFWVETHQLRNTGLETR